MSKSAVPKGYNTVCPYLTVQDAAGLIDFLVEVFGGRVKERMTRPDGSTGHAEVVIGDSLVMLGGTPDASGVRTAGLHVYVDDADATYHRALAAGASSYAVPETKFYGDRIGGVTDRFGNLWWISQHVEDVSAAEIQKRMAALAH